MDGGCSPSPLCGTLSSCGGLAPSELPWLVPGVNSLCQESEFLPKAAPGAVPEPWLGQRDRGSCFGGVGAAARENAQKAKAQRLANPSVDFSAALIPNPTSVIAAQDVPAEKKLPVLLWFLSWWFLDPVFIPGCTDRGTSAEPTQQLELVSDVESAEEFSPCSHFGKE